VLTENRTSADRGCHIVIVTDPYGRILDFLDWIRVILVYLYAQFVVRAVTENKTSADSVRTLLRPDGWLYGLPERCCSLQSKYRSATNGRVSAASPQIAYRETRVITLRPKQETIARREIAQLRELLTGQEMETLPVSVSLSVYLCICLSIYVSICLPGCVYLSAYVSICLPACLPACLSACLSVCLSVCLPACLPACPSVRPSIICLSVYLLACLSVCPSVRPSALLSLCLSIYPSIYPRAFLAVCLST
jgi:hypothetical protein